MHRFAFALSAVAAFSPHTARATTVERARTEVYVSSWRAPVECPQRDAVEQRVRALLQQRADLSARFRAEGEVQRDGDGYRLLLAMTISGRRGERVMRDVSCAELTEAATFVIGIAIDPELRVAAVDADVNQAAPVSDGSASAAASQIATSDVASSEQQPVVELRRARWSSLAVPSARVEAPRARAETSPLEAWLGAGVTTDLGTLPGLAPGAQASIAVRRGWAAAFVGGFWYPWRQTAPRGEQAVVGDFQWWGVDASACAGYWQQRIAPAACVGAALGSLSGRNAGVGVQRSASTFWLAPHVGGLVRLRVDGPVGVVIGGEVLFPIRTARFVLDNYGLVHETSRIAAHFQAALSVRFW